MDKSEREQRIIDYLYNEMDAQQREDFEKEMGNDEKLKDEVKGLQDVRGMMSDESFVSSPPQNKEQVPVYLLSDKTASWIRPYLAIAASFALLFVMGYLTNFNIKYNEEGLYVGFNKSSATHDPVSEETIKNLVADMVADQQATYQQQMVQTKDSLEKYYALIASFDQTNNSQKQIPSRSLSSDELQKQLEGWQASNQNMLQNYINAVNTHQQEYMEDALLQFSDYLQDQREQDLLLIQQNMIDLKNYQDRQKQETNEVLAEIIQTVNQQE